MATSRSWLCAAARASEYFPRASATSPRSVSMRSLRALSSSKPLSAATAESFAACDSVTLALMRTRASSSADRRATSCAAAFSARDSASCASLSALWAARRAARHSSSRWRAAASVAAALSASSRALPSAACAAASSLSSSARRLRCSSRCAAGVLASAAARYPSQRHRSPSRLTRRWPGLEFPLQARPSRASTTPICASLRASTLGARTCAESGSHPCGSACASSRSTSRQWIGAPSSAGTERSSPIAAPSAVS